MKLVRVIFKKMIYDSPEYGTNDKYVVSRVFFDIETAGTEFRGLYCNLRQTAGSDLMTGAIEVGAPVGYSGPFNYEEFSAYTRTYFRCLASSIPGSDNIRMRNIALGKVHAVEFAAT